MKFGQSLESHASNIEGLFVYQLPVHGDNRGWFKENWQRQKMAALGLPDFGPVQNNISYNAKRGVTRGLHAEPWDKFVTVAFGEVFGAWCDLRENSPTYGQTFSVNITPDTAVYVPRGVANGFQALEDDTVYTYLVNDHWSAEARYSNVHLSTLEWPIPLSDAELSKKDKRHPQLADASPVPPRKILVTGADGQLGKALRRVFPEAEFCARGDLDITSPNLSSARNWKQYQTIINAAAYTNVDAAENKGREMSWAINGSALASLASIANENGLTLVHISSDYVFDGTKSSYTEKDAFTPLGVYGQTKAAGDIAAATAKRHYILRTSWVVGAGANFVRTMANLAVKGVSPSVVDDQIGRPTFTEDIADGIKHLLATKANFGTYNLSNTGDPISWSHFAKEIYSAVGSKANQVTPVTTTEYYGDKPYAPRPSSSVLDLEKIEATGFVAREWRTGLNVYLTELSLSQLRTGKDQ